MSEGSIPEEWRTGIIVPIWQRKGVVQDLGSTEVLRDSVMSGRYYIGFWMGG